MTTRKVMPRILLAATALLAAVLIMLGPADVAHAQGKGKGGGGKQGGAVASGMVDGTGYLGGVAAGTVMARLSVVFGWGGVFVALALMSSLAALGACYLYVLNGRRLSAPAALAVAGPG